MQRIIVSFIFIVLMTVQSFAQTYNVEEAVSYAKRWCYGRNTAQYFDYGLQINGGADCAAFVSQCLIAGGLNLSAGTDGHGSYVKSDGVISGAQQLTDHLRSHQNTTTPKTVNYNSLIGNRDIGDHDLGDPCFNLAAANHAYHSHICSTVSGTNYLYSSHTNDVCDGTLSRSGLIEFFHIKSTYPAHCYDCIQNNGETSIDCGGPCPPCAHAPDNKTYTIANERIHLPAETYAISNITAQGSVTLMPGTNVSFYSVGSIDLLPGFWAKQGSNFTAEVKRSRLAATADCNIFCDPPGFVPNVLTPNGDGLNDQLIWIISNSRSIHVKIYQWKNYHGACLNTNYLVYENTIIPAQEGAVMLWDLFSGNPQYNSTFFHPVYTDQFGWYYFDAYVDIEACQGGTFSYIQTFWVMLNNNRSHSAQQEANNQDDTRYTIGHNITQYEDYEFSDMENPTDNSNYFSLYPNPTTGTLTINSNMPLEAFSDLIVTNSSGQTIYGQKYLDSFTLSLPALPNGEYILSLRIDGQPVSRKVILQR